MSQHFVDKLANKAGTGPTTLEYQSAAKAFHQYDQVSPNIEESLNISSMSDNGTGDWTANFTNSFSAATYAVFGSAIVRVGAARGGIMAGLDRNTTTPRAVGSMEGGTVQMSDSTNDAVASDIEQNSVSYDGTLA